MIFKKRKTGSEPIAEPKTRIDPFPGARSSASSPLKNKASAPDTGAQSLEEPPTRLAVFDPPILAKPTRDDPHVGMVIVIAGPGRGFTGPLSYGDNKIGRGSGMDVRLDFGDAELSDKDHACIKYNAKTRDFHIHPGSAENAITVGKKTVAKKPHKLRDRDRIVIGNTELLFLAICGDSFDWRADTAGTQD